MRVPLGYTAIGALSLTSEAWNQHRTPHPQPNRGDTDETFQCAAFNICLLFHSPLSSHFSLVCFFWEDV